MVRAWLFYRSCGSHSSWKSFCEPQFSAAISNKKILRQKIPGPALLILVDVYFMFFCVWGPSSFANGKMVNIKSNFKNKKDCQILLDYKHLLYDSHIKRIFFLSLYLLLVFRQPLSLIKLTNWRKITMDKAILVLKSSMQEQWMKNWSRHGRFHSTPQFFHWPML